MSDEFLRGLDRGELLKRGGIAAAGLAVGGSFLVRDAFAGSGSVAAADAKRRIGVSLWVDAEVHRQIIDWFERTAKKDKSGLVFNPVLDGKGDGVKQVTQAEAFLTQDFAGALIMNIQPEGWDDWGNRAKKKGLKTAAYTVPFSGVTFFSRAGNVSGGTGLATACAKWFKANHGGKGEWGLFELTSVPALRSRTKAMETTMKKLAPGVKLVGKYQAFSNETGATGAAALLQAHPNMKAILCFDDDAAMGALQTAREQGKTDPKEFWLGGVDATPLAIQELRKKDSLYQASASLLWEYSAVTVSHMLERAFINDPIPRWLDNGAYIVTKQNVKNYLAVKDGALNPKFAYIYRRYQKLMRTALPR